jgi:serine protease Do
VARVQSFINAAKAGDISPISTLVQRSSAPTIATIALNTPTVNASLAQGDRTLQDGSFGDYYQFSGRAGQKIVINMSSQEMNSFLLLYQVKESAQGQELEKIAENDDQGPGNFNSQIEATLPQDGTYLIIASSQERGESGNYTLQAITQP